jgi:mRNA-degrading endonuclease YafQ of YafQ-DinJ toxin-antitoxin module
MPILQATCEYKRVRGCSIKADVFLVVSLLKEQLN